MPLISDILSNLPKNLSFQLMSLPEKNNLLLTSLKIPIQPLKLSKEPLMMEFPKMLLHKKLNLLKHLSKNMKNQMIYIPPLKKSEELMKLMMLILKLKLSMTKKLPFKKKKNSSNKDYKKSMTSEKKLPVYSNKFKMKISVTKKFPATLISFLITLHLMQEPEIM